MLTAKEAAQWLISRDNFLILTHKSPDGDTIGSGAGLCIALREQGKTAFMLQNDEISDTFAPYAEGLQSSDYTPDFVVSVDIATEELFPDSAEKFKGKVDLAIDHHPIRNPFGKENCIFPEKSACGELVYEIVSQWGKLSKAVALPLYVALSTDTGCFVYGNTNAESHRVAGSLLETGLEVRDINKQLFQTVTLTQLKLESALLSTMRLFNEGTIAIVCVTQKMREELGVQDRDMENISSFISKVEGVSTGITVREKKDGICKLSMRSNPDILNATSVCEKLGGGGHAAASGAKVTGSVEETASAIIRSIEEVLGEKLVPCAL